MLYKLRAGAKFRNAQGQVVKPGELVELTEAQARAFKDQFEPVGGTAAAIVDVDDLAQKQAELKLAYEKLDEANAAVSKREEAVDKREAALAKREEAAKLVVAAPTDKDKK